MTIYKEPDFNLKVNYVRNRLFCVFNIFYSFNPEEKTGKRHVNLSDPKNFLKPKKIITINGKQKKIDAEPVRAGETGRFKSSTVLMSNINFVHLSWSRAIRGLPTHQQAWIRYCYGNSNNFADQTIVCEHIWNEFLKETERRKIKIKKSTLKVVRSLVWLAVQSSIVKIHTEKDLYKQSYLAFLAGKSKQAWKQNFCDKWHLLTGLCFELDKEALLNVDRNHYQ